MITNVDPEIQTIEDLFGGLVDAAGTVHINCHASSIRTSFVRVTDDGLRYRVSSFTDESVEHMTEYPRNETMSLELVEAAGRMAVLADFLSR